MLKRIEAEEFGPVGKKVEISFIAEKDTLEEQQKAEEFLISGTSFFKTIYIYGANNSGKSQVLKLIEFLKDIVIKGKNVFKSGYLPNVYIGKYQELKEKITWIKYIFEIEKEEYVYEMKLKLGKAEILFEKLCVNGENIFERLEEQAQNNEIEKDIFYLTNQYEQKGGSEKINKLYEYIQSIKYICRDRKNRQYEDEILEQLSEIKQHKIEINRILNRFDFDFQLEIKDTGIGLEKKEVLYSLKNKILSRFGVLESFGTKSFLKLLIEAMYSKGDTVVIDEIEIGLNFELLIKFIFFIQNKFPKKQFIITTHSTEILEEKLDKQQIYIAKIENNELSLLREFDKKRIRSEQNFRKIFVSGGVGGIPNIELKCDENGRD